MLSILYNSVFLLHTQMINTKTQIFKDIHREESFLWSPYIKINDIYLSLDMSVYMHVCALAQWLRKNQLMSAELTSLRKCKQKNKLNIVQKKKNLRTEPLRSREDKNIKWDWKFCWTLTEICSTESDWERKTHFPLTQALGRKETCSEAAEKVQF